MVPNINPSNVKDVARAAFPAWSVEFNTTAKTSYANA